MKIYSAECQRDMYPTSGKCYRMTLELHMDPGQGFGWNIMCYERPSMMSMMSESKGDVKPEYTWEVTVKDFPEDMESVIGMLKQKIMMSIEESYESSIKEYKRYILKGS